MSRRRLGQLEAEVLAALAGADGWVSATELRTRLDGEPAYTTVNTTLYRLCEKHLVARERRGRSFAYRLVVGEAELLADRMFDQLRYAHDTSVVLSEFVGRLSPQEEKVLRGILDQRGHP